jgi:predicted dehydrogenase
LTLEDLRIGVVGLGKMGLLHASLLNILPGVKLAAVCEKSSFTRKLVKKVLNGIPVVGDVSDFSGLNLDAVFVTTSTLSHFSVAKTVYQKQIASHLFIEKPLAWNYVQSKELCELAARNGGVNMVGYLRRFMVTFMKAKEMLNQDVIGEPVSFKVNGFSSDFFGIRRNPKMSMARGGVLRDLGSYAIDIALWFFGELEVKSASIESLTGLNAEDVVNFIMHRKSDLLEGEVSVTWCAEGYRMPEVILTVEGSKGNMEVNDDKVTVNLKNGKTSTWYRLNLDDTAQFWLGGPEYYREDAYFVDCIQNDLIAEPTFNAASRVDFLIDAIYRNAEKHE